MVARYGHALTELAEDQKYDKHVQVSPIRALQRPHRVYQLITKNQTSHDQQHEGRQYGLKDIVR